MKQILFTMISAAMLTPALAQDDKVITGTKSISKKETPEKVVQALESKFPDAKSVKYYQIPKTEAANGWAIAETDNLSEDSDVEYYTISFKRDDLKYYGLYRADGTLVRSKVEEQVTDLPEPIKQSIGKLQEQYPGYTITSKTYLKNTDHSKSTEAYEVTAVKGKEKKKLFYAPDGTITKVKG